jgi:hypothetical protein
MIINFMAMLFLSPLCLLAIGFLLFFLIGKIEE